MTGTEPAASRTQRITWSRTAVDVVGTTVGGYQIRVFEWPHAKAKDKTWAYTVRRTSYYFFEMGKETETRARRSALRHVRRLLKLESENA